MSCRQVQMSLTTLVCVEQMHAVFVEIYCLVISSSYMLCYAMLLLPLWSSGQSFWLQIQRSRVRSPALPDLLSSSGSGTGSTRPREVKLRSYLNKKSSGSRFRKQRLTAVGTRCANHVTPLYPQKLALTSPTGGGLSVGMVRSRTKSHGV